MAVTGHDLAEDLARRLRAARHLSGKKVGELAHDLGWSNQKIYRFEQGRQVPDVLELAEIAEATGQSIEFFLGRASRVGLPTMSPVVPVVNIEPA